VSAGRRPRILASLGLGAFRRQRAGSISFAVLFLLASTAVTSPLALERAEAVTGRAARPTIIIYKSKRRLLYFENDILKRRFSVVLGKEPRGQKVRRGDLRTPEGEYYVTSKKSKSRFHRFLGLSYPNIEDAERGMLKRLITRRDFERIKRAIRSGRQPPWSTPLGGYIGIHGEGEYRDFTGRYRINWTEGCISVSDRDMDVLYRLVEIGTPVLIFP
jgi:murein L,D-transpeptidase YafK